MKEKASPDKTTIITEIKQKIRLLNIIAAFIVITLLAVILRYLYKPVSESLDFLPDISITLIIGIILVLTVAGFYMWGIVSKKIIQSIERYRNRLNSIFAVTKDLREEKYGDILLDKIMNYSLSLTQSEAGSILLAEKDNLVFKIARGEKAVNLPGMSIPMDRGIAGWVAKNGQPLRILDVKNEGRFDPEVDAVTGYKTKSMLCVPLIVKTGIVGVIELLNKKDGDYNEMDEELITYLADQAAISIAKARFYEDQKNYEIHITDILLEALDFKIPDKIGHSKRVAKYSNILARAINMSEEKRKRLYFACLMHDVGFLKIKNDEIFVPDIFKKHPVIGYEMIKPVSLYEDIAPFILHHHERYDGSGYPAGLSGEDIPIESRIIAIAEAFDVMVSNFSYKLPVNFDYAVEELKRNAGSQFDFWLVEVFVSNISSEHCG
jgi:putative methionine-R-sulfoxide reductase with GAF domain